MICESSSMHHGEYLSISLLIYLLLSFLIFINTNDLIRISHFEFTYLLWIWSLNLAVGQAHVLSAFEKSKLQLCVIKCYKKQVYIISFFRKIYLLCLFAGV